MNLDDFSNIHEISFSKIKELLKQFNISKNYNTKEFDYILEILKCDNRKNVKKLSENIVIQKKKIINEISRVKKLYEFEEKFGVNGYIAGVDEVGRGPLAGPIVAAAVVLDHKDLDENLILGLNDSKKISEKRREEISDVIKKKAISYSIALCTNEQIDKLGIGYCNNKVFLDSIHTLSVKPKIVLSDGYPIKGIDILNESVIKGDTKAACIAAASIIAKVYRDNLMKEYAKEYPYYKFESNSGYGSREHIDAIHQYGICKIHRKSFLRNII